MKQQRNYNPKDGFSPTQLLANWLFRSARDDVRGAIAVVMFFGALILFATNPKPGYGTVAVVLVVLSIALFRVNHRRSKLPKRHTA